MPTSFSNIVINPDVWRFLGFGSSIVGFNCFALGSSFHKLFGQWNLLKIMVYSTVSFMFTVLMLFAKYSQQRFPRVFWLKTQVGFLVLMLTSLYSYYDDRSKQVETEGKGFRSILSLISIGAFALMSISLSAQVQPGFEVGMSNFFLGCLIVGVMKMSFKAGAGVAILCYAVMSIRSYLDSRQEQRHRRSDEPHEIVVVGDSLHEQTPPILPPLPLPLPLNIHRSPSFVSSGQYPSPSLSTLRRRPVNFGLFPALVLDRVETPTLPSQISLNTLECRSLSSEHYSTLLSLPPKWDFTTVHCAPTSEIPKISGTYPEQLIGPDDESG